MRSTWSGSMSFGLVNVPVKIYSAAKDRSLKFKLLDKDSLCPISYLKVCQGTTKEVKYENIVKGFEYEKGNYVLVTDEDFVNASPRKTKTIDIVAFVDESEVSKEFIEKPYYIEPEKKAEKAYVLLREAIKKSKKVAIAKVVFKEHEHLVLIEPKDDLLMLVQLRYQDQINNTEELHIPGKSEYSKKEMDTAMLLIDQLVDDHFDPKKYKDTYTEALKKLIDKKVKGKPIHIEEKAPIPSNMSDIMELLKKSLEQSKAR